MSEEKIQELQIVEQNLQNLFLQKQSFQMELSETESALNELESSGDEVFKIVGQLMVKTDKKKTQEELSEKLEILKLRVNSFEKQEISLTEKLENLRKEVIGK
mgnify:CR=1 FL=1|jgi:prefoldin beta subunit|tara:strand:+ start:118 stop:426 length:309 start_codon:yes stop_codon:yes gene_type:complete